jgi:hypothetical protein
MSDNISIFILTEDSEEAKAVVYSWKKQRGVHIPPTRAQVAAGVLRNHGEGRYHTASTLLAR